MSSRRARFAASTWRTEHPAVLPPLRWWFERFAVATKIDACSIHSNSQCRSSSGTPSKMQIACIGGSPATLVRSNVTPFRSCQQRACWRNSLEPDDGAGVTPSTRRRMRVARAVHHIEDHPGGRQILATCRHKALPPRSDEYVSGPSTPALLRLGRHRPEAFLIRRVHGRLVPRYRRLASMQREQIVREPACEVVEVGEVERQWFHRRRE
jgi:hypothetical protein